MPDLDESIVLVVGGGGREHALAWALARDDTVSEVLVAPGNGGTAREPGVTNVAIADGDVERLVALATERRAGLTVIGPEAPLAAGIVDAFRAAGLPVFGPTAAAARLEASKVWARELMARRGVPHPAFDVCETADAARAAARALGGRCVVKADGLAAGKGVIVCDGDADAERAIETIMVARKFGDAGARILVEERAEGPELSVMVATDGRDYALFPPAQDHKRLLDGDAGPNTGGMGAYCPAPIATTELLEDVERKVIRPILDGLGRAGRPFSGCLYAGLMLTGDGPVVIEFNARFGDPETQPQLALVAGGLADTLRGAARGDLAGARVAFREGAAACVVLAAGGYPERYETGHAIEGLAAAEAMDGVKVFHAGARIDGDRVVTSGGRVLGVVGVRPTLADALSGAYGAIGDGGVRFEGMHYRRDIGARALA